MNKHVMLDLETLSLDANGVIVSVGAVLFTAEDILDEFHMALNRDEQIRSGGVVSADTVDWWLTQTPEAQDVFRMVQHPVSYVLGMFTGWLTRYQPKGIWGNGAEMDNAMLAQLYRRNGYPVPWKHTASRCYRTAKNINVGWPLPAFDGVPHNAVDDARYQAQCLQAINKAMDSRLL